MSDKAIACKELRSITKLLAIAFSALTIFTIGCGKTTLGTDAYHLAGALDRIFEKRDPQQLQLASEKVKEELIAGKITATEADLLNGLISKAENGNWDRASKDARQLLAEQTNW
jgi:hypothetical protein